MPVSRKASALLRAPDPRERPKTSRWPDGPGPAPDGGRAVPRRRHAADRSSAPVAKASRPRVRYDRLGELRPEPAVPPLVAGIRRIVELAGIGRRRQRGQMAEDTHAIAGRDRHAISRDDQRGAARSRPPGGTIANGGYVDFDSRALVARQRGQRIVERRRHIVWRWRRLLPDKPARSRAERTCPNRREPANATARGAKPRRRQPRSRPSQSSRASSARAATAAARLARPHDGQSDPRPPSKAEKTIDHNANRRRNRHEHQRLIGGFGRRFDRVVGRMGASIANRKPTAVEQKKPALRAGFCGLR